MIAGLNELSRFWGEFAVQLVRYVWSGGSLRPGGKQDEVDQAKKTAAAIGETIMQNLGHLSIISEGISFVFLQLQMQMKSQMEMKIEMWF